MEGFAYFPAIIYRDERSEFLKDIRPVCLKYLREIRDCKSTLYQTRSIGKDIALSDFSSYILSSSIEILNSQGYDLSKYEIYVSGMWFQEINKGPGTNVHVHKNSQISGWYFIDAPENGAYPIYFDTRNNKNMVELDIVSSDDITNATNSIHFHNVIPGTVLFNNSWVQHQITSSSSELPTRCIHFIISHRER
jgi:uncharacterized protein (TIGR02466 family)